MIESWDFSTAQFKVGERYGRYRDLYATGADALSLGARFSADIKAWRLGRLVLFDRHLTDVGMERLAPRVKQDQFDHFTLQLNLGGEFHGEGDGGFRLVRPGELLLLDMAKPMRTRMPEAHVITLSLARELVEEAAGSAVDQLHGRLLKAKPSGLLADFLVSLTQRAPSLSAQAMPITARVLVELLRLALETDQSAATAARTQLDAIRFEAAQRFIEANLQGEQLGPEAVAAATGLSRATLYRMFEVSGGVAKYIQTRRLLALRNALRNPVERRTFATLALAMGFSSESHASKAFYNLYGVRPADFRQGVRERVQSDYGEEASAMKRRFTSWQAELR
jgi:AraC-like DNA-binding protein